MRVLKQLPRVTIFVNFFYDSLVQVLGVDLLLSEGLALLTGAPQEEEGRTSCIEL